jgi:hypothetical protein
MRRPIWANRKFLTKVNISRGRKTDREVLEEKLMQEARYVQPIVEKLPPNHRIVLCKVGEHENVRVLVGDNSRYVKGMKIPLDGFDPEVCLDYTGPKPGRNAWWGFEV